jgi:hypothetical protein
VRYRGTEASSAEVERDGEGVACMTQHAIVIMLNDISRSA